MLRQDPVECLFQFICSSNNHISRIHGMVERLCSTYGSPMLPASGSSGSREGSSQLASQQQQQQQTAGDSRGIKLEPGTPGAAGPGYPSQQAAQQQQQQQELRSLPLPFCQQEPQQLGGHWQQQAAEGPDQGSPSFYAFPTLEQLSAATEEALRADGFGYRWAAVWPASVQPVRRLQGPTLHVNMRVACAAMQFALATHVWCGNCMLAASWDVHAGPSTSWGLYIVHD
jgi:hypothetical protein